MDLREKILNLMKVFILFVFLEFHLLLLLLCASAQACSFNVYLDGSKIECRRSQFESQLCSILDTCPSVYQLNQILKGLQQSEVIGSFRLSFSNSTTLIYITPIIKLTNINVSGNIPSDVTRRLKDFMESKKFKNLNDVKIMCEDFLTQEGVFNPKCLVKFSDENVLIDVAGDVSFIRGVIVSAEDKALEEKILRMLEKYEGRRFFPALIQDMKKEVFPVLRKSGYMNPELNIYFESGTIYCYLNLGRKYVIFLQIEGGEILWLYEDEILEEIKENFSGSFSQYSLKLFLESYLKSRNIPYQSVLVSELALDEQISMVNISIKLQKLFYLEEFKIEGLKRLDESDIENYIGVNEKNILTFFYPRYALYQEKQIDTFIARIYEFAKSKGFLDFRIKDVKKTFSGDSMSVTIFVDEGERSVIDTISLNNFPEEISNEIDIPRTPLFYDRELLQNLKSEIEKICRNYVSEDFDVVIHERWKTRRLVDISFVYAGERRADFAKYVFVDSKTDDKFLKHMSDLGDGDRITLNLIDGAYENLNGTRYFDDVVIRVYPVSFGLSDRKSFLVLSAHEGKLNEFGISGGLSSVEGVRGSLDFTKRNMYYWGIDISFSISSAYWLFPFGREMGLTFLGFRSELVRRRLLMKSDVSLVFYPKYESTFLYNVQSPLFASMNISREFLPFKIAFSFIYVSRTLRSWQGFSIRPESATLKDVFVLSQGIYLKKSNLFASIKNDVVIPQRNISDRVELSLEFYNLKPLWGLGFVSSVGRIFLSDIFYVPVESRFFIGGFKGPRGYKEMSIYSDVSDALRMKHLNKILLMSELFSPKILFFRGYVFFDIGSVFHDSQEPKFYKGVGPGIFLESPFGSFRFELGYGIERRSFMIHFSFGLNRFTL